MNKFFENFHQKGLSTISFFFKDERKLNPFFRFIGDKCYHITDYNYYKINSKNRTSIVDPTFQKIENTLVNIKDQSVFIDMPLNQWYDTGVSKYRFQNERNCLEQLCRISYENNLSIILLVNSVNLFSTSFNSYHMYFSNYFINFENDKFNIVKNRYGSNDIIDLDNVSKYIKHKYRDKKLKRILYDK